MQKMPHVRRGVIMLGNVVSPYNVKLLLGFYKFRTPAKKFRNLEQLLYLFIRKPSDEVKKYVPGYQIYLQ
jgi:hypothetical protein